jgi:hypothetical protein
MMALTLSNISSVVVATNVTEDLIFLPKFFSSYPFDSSTTGTIYFIYERHVIFLIFIGHFTRLVNFILDCIETKSIIYFHLLLETTDIICSQLNLTNICHIMISKKFSYFLLILNFYGAKIQILFHSCFTLHM